MGKCVRFLIIQTVSNCNRCFTVMLSTFTAVVTIHLRSVEVFLENCVSLSLYIAGYLTVIMLLL